MDLSSLYTTLSGPPDRLQQAENEMMERFKAAALSITHLYKSSVHTSKQAYRAGYSECLNDVLQTLQASLSATATASNVSTPAATPADSRMNEELERSAEHGSALEGESAGKVLERLMDWIEARQETIKIETEEDKEKEEAEASSLNARSAQSNTTTRRSTMGSDSTTQAHLEHRDNTDKSSQPPSRVPSTIRQRDALVQAVANARGKNQSKNSDTLLGNVGIQNNDVAADKPYEAERPPASVAARSSSPSLSRTPNAHFRDNDEPSLSLPSSPLTHPSVTTPRSLKPFGHYRGGPDHRSKLLNLNRRAGGLLGVDQHGFNPNFGGKDVPLYPGRSGIVDHRHDVDPVDIGTAPHGGKRRFENAFAAAIPTGGDLFDNASGVVSNPTPVISGSPNPGSGLVPGSGRARRRTMGPHGAFSSHQGFAKFARLRAAGSEGEGEEPVDGRERKRLARR